MPATTAPLRLNIGCGDTARPGYVGVDIRPAGGADHVAAAWDLSAFGPASVAEIYSRHMLEHLDPNDARRTLAAWLAALQPGGQLRLIVPDLAFHAQQLLGAATNWSTEREENERHALAGFFGWRDESRGGDREDAHRWGYTEASLRALLSESGFVDVRRVTAGEDSQPWHLHLTAGKRAGAGAESPHDPRRWPDASVPSEDHPTGGPGLARASPEPGRAAAENGHATSGLSPQHPAPPVTVGQSANPCLLCRGESATTAAAQAAARAVLNDWRGRGRIVVYGAGGHTRKILPALLTFADRIAGIADDSPATWGTVIGRWTVAPPASVVGASVGGVLVSSDTQQTPLAARARTRFGDRCAILTLYVVADPAHDCGPASDGVILPDTGERQTGRCLEEIEIGHRARYYWAAQRLAPEARVLDAACGNGYGSRILAECGARVVGIDIAPGAIAFARRHFAHEHVLFATAGIDDGRTLHLAAERRGPFDAVVSLETLEHLERPNVFLRDAAVLLHAGGELFCSTPNADMMDLAEAPYHRRHFTTAEARALLESCGFELLAWFGQEGLQILPGRTSDRQRYCLYHARRL